MAGTSGRRYAELQGRAIGHAVADAFQWIWWSLDPLPGNSPNAGMLLRIARHHRWRARLVCYRANVSFNGRADWTQRHRLFTLTSGLDRLTVANRHLV